MDKNKKQNESEKVGKKEEVIAEEPKIDSRVEELENQVKRTLADYRNLENRVSQERGEWILKANKQLLLNILPVLDTLVQASKHSKDQSLALSLQQFLGILEKEGIRKIETEGEDFDPVSMEGIGSVEGEDGKVIQEARAGYMLYDKVLRPAQVQVGRGK